MLYRLFNVIVILFLTNVCNEKSNALYYNELGIEVRKGAFMTGAIFLLTSIAVSIR